jgi:AraC family transcriptional regulator of arabinose operon
MHGPTFLLHKTIMSIPGFPAFLRLVRPHLHHCEKEWRWRPSALPDFDLWMVLDGVGEIEIRRQKFPLRTGTGFLFQPGDLPRGQHDPAHPLIVFACHFRLAAPSKTSRRLQPGIIHAQLREWELIRQSCDQAARAFDEGATGRDLTETLVAQLVAQLLHAQGRPAGALKLEPLSSLALEIRSQPARTWKVPEMARRCAMSPPHFNRRFRRQLGESPLRYVIRSRVARATILLRESDLPLARIAELTGYQDAFFFHRQFRQIAGVTPRSVRLGASSRLDELPREI